MAVPVSVRLSFDGPSSGIFFEPAIGAPVFNCALNMQIPIAELVDALSAFQSKHKKDDAEQQILQPTAPDESGDIGPSLLTRLMQADPAEAQSARLAVAPSVHEAAPPNSSNGRLSVDAIRIPEQSVEGAEVLSEPLSWEGCENHTGADSASDAEIPPPREEPALRNHARTGISSWPQGQFAETRFPEDEPSWSKWGNDTNWMQDQDAESHWQDWDEKRGSHTTPWHGAGGRQAGPKSRKWGDGSTRWTTTVTKTRWQTSSAHNAKEGEEMHGTWAPQFDLPKSKGRIKQTSKTQPVGNKHGHESRQIKVCNLPPDVDTSDSW